MTERIPRSVIAGAALSGPLFLAYLAYSRPGYFTSQLYLVGLLLLEVLVVAVCFYRRVFFPLTLVSFLFAGINLPVGYGWTTARWVFLGVGAAVGTVIVVKERVAQRFELFHAIAFFTVLAALTSAAVSRYPSVALLKSLSLFLLFLYCSTGVRVAVNGRENQFFEGLVTGCELFVGGIAAFHVVGIEAMGNPNSLGAVMGVVGAPILLWGSMVEDRPFVRRRRLFLYAVCMYLLFISHSRASMAAGMFSFAMLTVALRRYKLLVQGLATILAFVAIVALFFPEAFSSKVSSLATSVVFKGGDREHGLLASRESPWQAAMDNIHNHFWFGTGFGTTETGGDASEHLGKVASTSDVSAENGSSYLAITTWVGVAGALPFLFLVLALLERVLRTLVWMLRTGNPCHPAVPLAAVAVAGLLHAGFEDWLFAPGYYLCIFFWSMAFVLVDWAPSSRLPDLRFAWRPTRTTRDFSGVPATR